MPAKYLYWDYTSTGGTWRTSSHGRGHRVGVDFDICNSVCVPDDRPEPEEIDI